jgi:uncharacterized membrane protein
MKAEKAERIGSPARAAAVVYAGAFVYALIFAAAVTLHYLSFQEARLDLGNMVQAIWSTAHGHLLQATSPTGNEVSRLGTHVDPFLAFLVPLWLVWSSPIALLVLQAAAVATGALPVYWLARKHLRSERAGAHFAFAYLLFPATQFNAFTGGAGFHSVSIAVPLLLFAIWFLDEGKLAPFIPIALIAATTKEEIPAAIACLGLWYAVRKRERLVGFAIFVAGVGAFLVNFLVVIPHFSPSGIDPFAARYSGVGATPRGALHTVLHDPLAYVHTAATWHKLLFVVLVLVPFLGLWLLEPLLALGAAPDLLINLLSSKPEQTTIVFHYTAGIIPFIVAASIFGAAKLRKDPDRTSFYALAGAACIALYSPIYFAGHDFRTVLGSDAIRQVKATAIGLVPAGVPVSASNQLAGYLSARKRIIVFPYVAEAHWVVVDGNDPTYEDVSGYERAIRKIDAAGDWRVVYSERGVQVLKKTETSRGSS